MALFRIEQSGLEKLVAIGFDTEAELNKLIDSNLETLMGVRFLEAEYPIPGGRIETFGIDEHSVPVVVEYKKGQAPGAIVQGLFYLQWVTQNRRSFELIVREKMGVKAKVNWSVSPRLIIVARDFTVRDLAAVSLIAAKVELKRYARYGDLLQIDDVTPVTKKAITKDGTEKNEENEEEKYTIESLLKKLSPPAPRSRAVLRSARTYPIPTLRAGEGR